MESRQVPQPGQVAPAFELPDSMGKLRRLAELVANGPRAFVFYRGYW